VLFDGAPVDDTVERNGARLGIDFAAVEGVVLSHGHWDHAGGCPRRWS
jgi:7,8-dihydropterin-6-yl-methyl-4-(beta-D-ribofuranosyl)aminobenzene 5'-phosphate synthase